jgi:starvation-inducible DNA-binding protein
MTQASRTNFAVGIWLRLRDQATNGVRFRAAMHDVVKPSRSKSKALPHATAIRLSAEARSGVVAILNQQLANISDLHSQTKQAHWNVRGQEFYQLHKLFDEIAAPLPEFIDMIAERTVALGGVALGTVRSAAENSEIEEFSRHPGAFDYVKDLAKRFGTVGNSVRLGIDKTTELGDMGTADLLTEISRDLNKSLYFLEAHFRG